MIHIEQILSSTDVIEIPINLTATSIYTKAFRLENSQYFAFSYKASTGTPSLLLQLEQATVAPATEGVSDSNYVIPTNGADIVTLLNTSVTTHSSYSPISLPFGRIKITTVAGTPTNTTLNMKFCAYENYD